VFWLSHHYPEELHRCYRIGGVAVCARCLGTYPVLFAVLAAQFALHAPLSHPADQWAGTALVVPATLDWALGRFHPGRFGNPWRTLTGALLGVGLARSLFIHLQRPLPAVLWGQLAVVTVVALPVILATYRHRGRR
jgi:uncharacterized membrane protein